MRKMMWLAAGLAVSLAGCDLAGPGGSPGYGYNSNGYYSQPGYGNSNGFYGQPGGNYPPNGYGPPRYGSYQPQPYYRSGPTYGSYN